MKQTTFTWTGLKAVARNLILISGIVAASILGADAQQTTAFLSRYMPGSYDPAAHEVLSGTISRPGSSQDYYYDSQSNSWVHGANSTYTYTSSGKILESISHEAGTGQLLGKDTYTYDAAGNQTGYGRFSNGMNGLFQLKGNRHSFSYNATGKITEDIYETFSWGLWEKVEKRNLDYNPDGTLNEIIFSDWDTLSNSWVLHRKESYVYTNGTITAILGQVYLNGAWVTETQITNFTWHQVNLLPLSFAVQQFQNNNWVNFKQLSVTYDNLGGFVRVWKHYAGGNWENATRETVSYDQFKTYTGTEQEIWSPNGFWIKDAEELQTLQYNSSNDITERIYQFWNPQNQTMRYGSRYVYSNFQYFIMGIKSGQAQLVAQVYPNPVQQNLSITLPEQLVEATALQITDISGRILVNQTIAAGALQTEINIGHLPSGIYLVQLQNQTRRQIFKIAKQ